MKKYLRRLAILIIGIFLLTCFGCGKKAVKSDFKHPIIGKWRWVESVGGIGGIRITPESVGYTQTHIFQGDLTFLGYKNDALIITAKYTITEKPVWELDTAEVLQVEGQIEQIIGFRGNDSLDLGDHVIDGFNHLFVRIKSD
jgi:hypothetical protein